MRDRFFVNFSTWLVMETSERAGREGEGRGRSTRAYPDNFTGVAVGDKGTLLALETAVMFTQTPVYERPLLLLFMFLRVEGVGGMAEV